MCTSPDLGSALPECSAEGVPVLRLGSRGPGGVARSLRLWTQASAIVRKRPRSVGHALDMHRTSRRRKSLRNAEQSSLFTFRYKSVNSHRDWGGAVATRSRHAELSSLLNSSPVFASQKCQLSQGSGGRGRETHICRHF